MNPNYCCDIMLLFIMKSRLLLYKTFSKIFAMLDINEIDL